LRRLLVPGAWLGAALWALHPVQVESVAWITELKNTESGFFFLLTILFFVKGLGAGDLAKPREWDWNYTLTLLFAALAMASKSSAVILPVVLCLCAWWVEVRWHWRNLARMVPIVLMSAVASAGTLWTQKLELATVTDPQWTRTWSERLATAGDAFWFYLGKLLWPHPIIAIYPRWQIDTASWLSYAPLVALLIVFVVLWSNRRSWSRPWFFVFAWFLATLLPVLGLVNSTYFYYSFVADHFQYLASMAPLAQAGTGLVRFADCVSPGKRWLPSTLAAGLLLLLAMLSWRRAWAFENDEVLWTDTLAKNPKCWLAAYNLGHALDQSGRIEQAIPLYRKALEIRPDYPQAHTNLGMALLNQGQKSEAMEHFQEAVKLDPNYSDARSNLGVCLAIMGKTEEAISQFQKALEIEPDNAEVQNNLGSLFLKMGQMNQAILHYQLAVQINPDDSTAQANLAKAQAALRAPPTHQPK